MLGVPPDSVDERQNLIELGGENVDTERLEAAVRAVIARHGMLRVQVLDDGTGPGGVKWQLRPYGSS
jgi:hypothetical protein